MRARGILTPDMPLPWLGEGECASLSLYRGFRDEVRARALVGRRHLDTGAFELVADECLHGGAVLSLSLTIGERSYAISSLYVLLDVLMRGVEGARCLT
jgi:hypothetical protein